MTTTPRRPEATDTAETTIWRLGPYALLLLALVGQLAVVPFLPGGEAGGLLWRVTWSIVILAGLLTSIRRKKVLWLAGFVALPSLAMSWLSEVEAIPGGELERALSVAFYLGFVTIMILRRLLSQTSVTTDQILGAVNVYLLLAVFFAQLHFAIETLRPGAYQQDGAALTEVIATANHDLSEAFVYYSLTTLTTLGYGDIHPVYHGARVLSTAEAVVGQLFVAILIARLVSLHSGRNDAP